MHVPRRRFSSAATASFSGYVENNRPPPPPTGDDFYSGRREDDMSSDATVLCQESEAEDDLQSFLHEQSNHLLEARLREQQQTLPYCQRSTFDGFAAAPGIPRQQLPVANAVRLPPDAFHREVLRRQRGHALSWGFQQDLAEYEASVQHGVRGIGGMLYPLQPNGYTVHNDRPPFQVQPSWKSGHGVRKEGMNESGNSPVDGGHEAQQKKRSKSRRRGRRGGRGRKTAERPADDVPKLDKNLEDELAQEMANHISNKSALAHSFSSLRLHVAGGGTMIILNDKEITGCQKPSEPKNKEMAASGGHSTTAESFPLKDEEASLEMLQGNQNRMLRPKGCGAFFPPQVLKQLQGDTQSSNPDPSFVSQPSTPTSGLNVKAMPYAPSESMQSLEKSTQQPLRGKPGTGCFIPAYSQDPTSPEIDPSLMLESVSLVESLGCLENPEESINPLPGHDVFDPSESCGVGSPLVEKSGKGMHVGEERPHVGASALDPGNDLIQLMETDDYKTFTSPLHLEETLDGIQAEREAREDAEQKLINVQIENEELRQTIRQQGELTSQLHRTKAANAVLQMLLFAEWHKSKRRMLRKSTPVGLADPLGQRPEAKEDPPKKAKNVKETKKEERSTPPRVKRPKSALKSVSSSVPKPTETKKTVKSEKRGAEVRKRDQEEVKPAASEMKTSVSLKPATAPSGVKKHPVRCSSHFRSMEDVGEEVRKIKKSAKATSKHSRAASSSNAMRF